MYRIVVVTFPHVGQVVEQVVFPLRNSIAAIYNPTFYIPSVSYELDFHDTST